GMIYLTAGTNILKLDAATGKTVWRYSTAPGDGARGGRAGGRGAGEGGRGGAAPGVAQNGTPDREGVALGDGLVFVGTSAAHAIAVREDTGEQVWNVYVGEDARDK